MATRHYGRGFYGNANEDPISKKIKTKLETGPQLQRAALGNIRNNKFILKKNVGKPLEKKKITVSTNLSEKENIVQNVKIINDVKDESMEVEETVVSHVEELSIAFSSQSLHIDDIDELDKDNPQLVSHYVVDIYKYLWELENRSKVKSNYLEGQKITHKMRGILIDWLVLVHSRFSLLQETLYLTVAIIDRYLMTNRFINKDQLQLVGVTSMFVACKYEEMYIPEIGDFVYITDKTFTKSDIITMEVKILNTLNFYISYPLPLHFLRRNSKAGMVDAAQHTLAKYIMELSLPEYAFCHIKPSMLAAASLYLSMNLISVGTTWTNTLSYYSKYSEREIMPVVQKLASLIIKSHGSKLRAIKKKYASEKFMSISNIKELDGSSRQLAKFATSSK